MTTRGLVLLLGLIVIFAIQVLASGGKLKPLGLYHWGGFVVALGLLWTLAAI
jgi:hypothetical protein